jgi:hypothetical protein
MVLLGAAAIVQQDRRSPVSHTPGIPASGARHHQSPPRRGAPLGLRSVRLRFAKPRPRRRNTAREGSLKNRRPAWELADAATVPATLEHA